MENTTYLANLAPFDARLYCSRCGVAWNLNRFGTEIVDAECRCCGAAVPVSWTRAIDLEVGDLISYDFVAYKVTAINVDGENVEVTMAGWAGSVRTVTYSASDAVEFPS